MDPQTRAGVRVRRFSAPVCHGNFWHFWPEPFFAGFLRPRSTHGTHVAMRHARDAFISTYPQEGIPMALDPQNLKKLGIKNLILCDLNIKRAKSLGEKIDSTIFYTSYQKAVQENSDITAAIISTPTIFHPFA